VFITGNSGFPKSLDVGKSIDKAEDAERKVVGECDPRSVYDGIKRDSDPTYDGLGTEDDTAGLKDKGTKHDVTTPATDAAERWDGFKTTLKPATEFVCVARAPFDGTVAENIQRHGTGALNIDATRVEAADSSWSVESNNDIRGANYGDSDDTGRVDSGSTPVTGGEDGRYPSNVVYDERAAEQLDRDVGEMVTGDTVTRGDSQMFNLTDEGTPPEYTDTGGPSRYFYTSKASRAERTHDGKIENDHPTVKPVDLMEWLVKLVTAEGQIVCDPFAGSGTTLLAAKNKNRRFIGIEQDEGHVSLAQARVGLTPDDPEQIRDDDATGLEQFATDGGEE
jgi:site-specific DNA-methyltransferase (adenine-specific)